MDYFKEKRSLNDRRKFTYTVYVPERRSGDDRRDIFTNKIKERVA